MGLSSPSAAQLTRATDYGLEKVKRDIWTLTKKWKLLRTTQYLGIRAGVSRYANPSDFEADIQEPGMAILDGNSRSTIQTASGANITLAAAEAVGQAQAEGNLLMLTSGTGANQAEQIDDYSTTTKVAVLRAALTTLPVAGDGYLVVEKHWPITKKPWSRRNQLVQPGLQARPYEAYEMGSGSTGYVELYPVPDRVYGLKRDYYANLLMVDLSSTLYTVILRNWAGVLTQGVMAWIEAGYDDTRRKTEEQIYRGMLTQLKAMETDLMDESNLQQQVSD